jgi:hypothetical protein
MRWLINTLLIGSVSAGLLKGIDPILTPELLKVNLKFVSSPSF